jgi:hypothetical protein
MTLVTALRRSATRTLVILTAAGGLLVAGGPLSADAAGPSGAPGPTWVLGAVLGQPAPGQPTSTGRHQRSRSDYGHTAAPDGRLRPGCHDYPYRYVLTPPTNDWTLETFITDRTGDGVASGAFFSDSDPKQLRTHFRVCRYSVHAGRFTIRAKLHWYSSDGTDHLVWLPRSHFRLHR